MLLTFYDRSDTWQKMLPLTFTRPVCDIRVGILKIHEKWARLLKAENTAFRTERYLDEAFPQPARKSLTLWGNVLPSEELLLKVKSLQEDEVIIHNEIVIAGFFEPKEKIEIANRKCTELSEVRKMDFPWDIFGINESEIKRDFKLLTEGRPSMPIDDAHTITYGTDVFLEQGAKVRSAILNAESGPIYLGKNAEVQEGAIIRGPFSLGNDSVVKMGAKIRGGCTIGPFSKAGGEISNAVLQGFANKGHDGFLGNSVIGEWCNLGADTNNSNLKNNYTNVKMWDYASKRFKDTGLQFCGLIMGDHSKCGINTMFNTGTSIGVFANIFGSGFPRNIIPSFAWGGASGFSTYQTKKAFDTAELVMQRRGKTLSDADKGILSHIFEMTSNYRMWEKK